MTMFLEKKNENSAIILPNGRKVGEPIEIHEYWVGKIRDVRARGDTDVWTYVQWYWSPQEVRTHVKSFDDTLCSPYERVFSDNFDYVSTSAFDAVVPLYKLNDGDLLQPYIPWDTFYTRYSFEHRTRIISVRHSPLPPVHLSTNNSPSSSSSSSSSSDTQPKPGEYSCLCQVPYAPLSLETPAHFAVMTTTKGKDKEKTTSVTGKVPKSHTLMHYCPRPTCRRFYHASCLLAAKCLDPDTGVASRKRRLLCASPDVKGEFVLGRAPSEKNGIQANEGELESELEMGPERKRIRVGTPVGDSSIPAPTTKARGRGRGQGRGRGRGRGRSRGRGRGGSTAAPAPPTPSPSPSPSSADDDAEIELLLASLPPDLVQIAEQPIVRGAAWHTGGLSGNLGAVVRARRIVYKAVLGGGWNSEEEEYALDGWEEKVGVVKRAVVELDSRSSVTEEAHGDKGDEAGAREGEGEVEGNKTKEKGRGRRRRRKASTTTRKVDDHDNEGVLPFLCPQCQGAI
ncbi:hypothetical protein C0989_006564 [Termitomyces sp. Mn162]|nr:hypothetical protein C0989_006564 [Termitomyces sp. Mn162]